MIKTNYLTGMALGLLLALCGCSTGEEAVDELRGTIPVGFSGDVPETRVATEYGSAADLSSIGVFVYFVNGTFSENNSTPNFMYNQQVNRQGDGSWTYSPVKYWPGNETDRISFFCLCPLRR
ncbi:MAG: fimbrillin family protein [Bacteroides sp.]|nr:fimbrillin family protein [Bacteroides sp.]